MAITTTTMLHPSQHVTSQTRYRLPAVLMRAGTSKGLFIHRYNMPKHISDWNKVLLAAMGSKEGDNRQIDGIGGGSSTTSKVIIVSKSQLPGIDVEYTFVQVAVGKAAIDMTGNCGNMSSGVAAFALDEGLIQARPGETELSVRAYNTNTRATIIETIQVDPDGRFCDEGSYSIPGTKSKGSPIRLTFENPSGSMTGSLFPTGRLQEVLSIAPITLPAGDVLPPFTVQATLIDSANPFVFLDSSTLPEINCSASHDSAVILSTMESIRREAAVRFGLAETVKEAALVQGTPKIAILSRPVLSRPLSMDQPGPYGKPPDIQVVAYSMGKVHPSLQLTGAVTLGAAMSIPGTVAAEISARTAPGDVLSPPETPSEGSTGNLVEKPTRAVEVVEKNWLIAHPSGLMDVQVRVSGEIEIESVTVFRTARRLFEGTVLVTL